MELLSDTHDLNSLICGINMALGQVLVLRIPCRVYITRGRTFVFFLFGYLIAA